MGEFWDGFKDVFDFVTARGCGAALAYLLATAAGIFVMVLLILALSMLIS